MTFAQNLANAAAAATCNFLSNGGTAALMPWVIRGLLTPGAQVPSAAAGLGLAALNIGCAFDPSGTAPGNEKLVIGCTKVLPGGSITLYDKNNLLLSGSRHFTELLDVYNTSDGLVAFRVMSPWGVDLYYGNPANAPFRTSHSGACADGSGGGWGPPPVLPPYQYQGGDAECDLTVDFGAWLQGDDGSVRPVLKISPATPTGLATGGVISGCNFNPVIYVGGGGGGGGEPPWWAPWQDGPNEFGKEPWWYSLIRGAAGGLAAAAVSKLLDEIFAARLPATVYRLTSVCETGTNGGAVDLVREVVIPEAKILEGIAKRLDALPVLDQGLKDFRQPVCPTPRPTITGELVTVNFKSIAPSPAGTRSLRKLLRYRDQTGAHRDVHVAHWEFFEWDAGPVMVASKGAQWGIVQVWAATADEGKRVIGHAAQVAGVDLTQANHEWVISSPKDPRYGQTGRMRVDRRDDHWIRVSKRPGPDGLPVLSGPVLDP